MGGEWSQFDVEWIGVGLVWGLGEAPGGEEALIAARDE